MSKNRVCFLIVVVFLTGCQQNVRSTEKNQPVAEAQSLEAAPVEASIHKPKTLAAINAQQPKVLTAAEKLTLELIKQGEMALAADRLLTPEGDNANLYFQAALGREPGNYRAIQGITAIVDLYTQWAWQAAQNRDYTKAARYLDFSRSVNPQDPVIVEMTSRIGDLKTKRRQVNKIATQKTTPKTAQKGQYSLPENLFNLSEEEIIAKIQPIIEEVTKTKQSIEIYWPNDKEARLIYQIINSHVTEFRVRAMTYHRADYRVELQQD
ncbi:hypothetical protein HGG82_12260 [Marinomonas sp. M1K-6]|uniref:Lipoprotein n=1 Tax=Marinomonas profundi TaxID=2726122 RepID=A0A847QXG4_9GAMM|nr:hypothetical protein [Marinomonas profundi]NLQ18388.1 hypothetical protein [Marinomonas profundi]UDV02445.1 hypothetical protein J8N69_12715 [Marinomonas profundi]